MMEIDIGSGVKWDGTLAIAGNATEANSAKLQVVF